MTPNLIHAVIKQFIIHNTLNIQEYISKDPKLVISNFHNFHNSYFICFVYFVYLVYTRYVFGHVNMDSGILISVSGFERSRSICGAATEDGVAKKSPIA